MIRVYGAPTCSRCKTIQMMLDKRNISYEYVTVDNKYPYEIPTLETPDGLYHGKDAMLEIRTWARK